MLDNKIKRNRKIIGSYIKYIRKEENLSMSFVGEVLNINKGYLSKIENGDTNISLDILLKVAKLVDITFINDDSLLDKSKQILLKLVEAHFSMNQSKIQSILESYFLCFSSCKYSLAVFHYLLIELYYEVEVKKDLKKSKELIELLEEYYEDVFDVKEQLFFIMMKAFYYQYHYQFVESLKYLKKAGELYTGINNLNFLGVIYHRMAVVYFYLNDGFSSYRYAEKARMIFRDTLYFRRVQHISICIASGLVLLNRYDEAEEIYKKLLDNLEHEEKEFKVLILNSLIWKSMKAEEYENALEYITQSKELGNTSYLLKACTPTAYYFLDRKEEALKEIETILMNRPIDSYLNLLLELLKFDIQDDNQKFEITSKQLERKLKNDENFKFYDIYLELMLNHYKRIGDKDKEIDIQEYMIHKL